MQAHIHTNTYTIDLIILNDLFKHLLSLILDVLCSCYKNIKSDFLACWKNVEKFGQRNPVILGVEEAATDSHHLMASFGMQQWKH